MKIPVLTYHSVNVNGTNYANNDTIAFERDLQLIHELGVKVISTTTLYQWLTGEIQLDESCRYVVLTFDDGVELDYRDWIHPLHGEIKSFYNCLKAYENVHATSFVIASPTARKQLEATCLGGFELWGDSWWQEVEDSGLISIENHSWDHLHPTLPTVEHSQNAKGDFSRVSSKSDADLQIAQASSYIDEKLNKTTQFFAYPYGDYNQFLTEGYFPYQQNQIKAAFSCDADFVKVDTNLWKIPRFVCGKDWNKPEKLRKILLRDLCTTRETR